ncbi:sensor domain-containing diguanylate cyclase [Roseibium sp. SCP14]|uniref:sensor domain-containing diguanylate cyclase n=1 Tax=Roseibium sp. SCP14 TaxID=3141375 RepID=UPI003337B3FB
MNDKKQGYIDENAKKPRQHISRLAFLLAGLLIAVTSVSLVFVGFIASRASTQQAVANEKRLFRSTLSDRLRAIVRDQVELTSSDVSVQNLVREFDPDFVRKSFDDLWSEHHLSKVMLISGGDKVLAETFEDYTHIIQRPVNETPGLEIVVDKLRDMYRRNRVRVPGGFGHRSLRGIDQSEYAIMGFLQIDGKPALFGAMPVIPDNHEVTLPDGPPTILLSARYIEDKLLKRLNRQLKFASLTFVNGPGEREIGPFHPVLDQSGEPIGIFQWDSKTISTSIWPTIIPVIAVLSIALAALAFGIAWRIGQLTTSLQMSERQNRYLALHDSLSGLSNRLHFNRMLEASVRSLPARPFAVLHCDLDNFKPVNDTFGHATGDLVIKTVATRLKDAVGDQGLVCRVGGDEFMVIYQGPINKAHLTRLSRMLVASVSDPIFVSEKDSVNVGLSVGVARAPSDGSNAETLVGRSDQALYQSKVKGRGQVSFYSDIREPQTASQMLIRLHETSPRQALGT